MRPQIPVPSKGLQLKATWGAQVANRVNELCAMAPAGVLHREGFGGIGDQALPKNMRDRRAAGAGQPMPFDLKGVLETSQDGTQQRLIVKWYQPGAAVVWNLWPLTAPSVTPDSDGWVTVYTGEYVTAGELDESVPVELWYTLEVSPDWTASPPTFAVTGDWEVIDNSDEDYQDEEFSPVGTTQKVVSYVSLGTVEAQGASVSIRQSFHGELHLHDLLLGAPDPAPTPFQYVISETTPEEGEEGGEEGGEPVVEYKIVNCRFYWDGEYQTLQDFTAVPATGTVYLVATKTGSGAGSWSFALSTSGGSGSASDTSQYIKLYDFVNHEVTMDYRTTTLMFGPGPRDYFAVEKQGSQSATPGKIELDTTGNNPQVTLTGPSGYFYFSDYELHIQGDTNGEEATLSANGGSHNIDLQTADATQGDVRIRECDYYAPNAAAPKKVNVVASEAMTFGVASLPNADYLTGVSFAIANGKLVATLSKKNMRSGATSTSTVDVCKVRDVDVVIDTDYTSPDFTQQKQSVTVIGEAPSSSLPAENVFTTTALSGELGS